METRRLKALAWDLARSPIPYFAGLSVFLLFVHEPWRDEAEHWLLVRDTPDLGAFFDALRYEGTPGLWHFLMMPLAELGLPFMSARILHAAIAVAGVGLVWYLAPFRPSEKWLLAFGYYTAYEFNAIARSYALFAMLLFVVASMDRSSRRRPMAYAIALVLLANTSLHGLIAAGIIATAYGLGALRNRSWTARVSLAGGVAVVGFALAAWQMRPAPDLAPWLAQWHVSPPDDAPRLPNLFKSVLEGFVPIPAGQQDFWNSSIFQPLSASVKTALAVLLFTASCWTLRRQLAIMGVYVAIALVMAALFVFKYYGGAHHAGLLFLVYVHCLWVARARTTEATSRLDKPSISSPRRWTVRADAAVAWFLPVILVLQVVAAGVAIDRDARGQFSAAGEVAQYLEGQGLLGDDTFIAVYHSFSATGILAQIHDSDRKFFLVEVNRTGTFTPWSEQWQAATHLTIDQVLGRVDAAAVGFERVVLIVNFDVEAPTGWADGTSRLTRLASFGAGVVGSLEEQYDVYMVKPAGTANGPSLVNRP